MRRDRTIAGVGRPTLELIGTAHRLPPPGHSAELLQFSVQGGGAVATALVALLEWGYQCRLAGRVSNDAMGRLIREGFEFDGFDASGLVVVPGQVSPFSIITLQEATEMERTVLQTAGTLTPLFAGELRRGFSEGCDALLVDGSEPEAQIAAADEARRHDIPVLYDASEEGPRSRDLLALSNLLVASERFAAEVCPCSELRQSLHCLRDLGPRLVIVTMGKDGSLGLGEGDLVQQPIFGEIQPRERGGAGHVFFAGVAHGFVQGWDLARLIRFATAAAGLSCREIGARGGIPTLAETLALSGLTRDL
ncbi:MAG: PfkB family carbohydrate kinase [Polyangia bacterium]|jgi:sugar/nucleoside kinase (ribokinase family)|nr:PfkB family carbohydrate kinase [Polyangia bacterium]